MSPLAILVIAVVFLFAALAVANIFGSPGRRTGSSYRTKMAGRHRPLQFEWLGARNMLNGNPMADLVGTSFSINPSSATPGAAINVNSSVANQGGSPAGGFYAEIVLSQDGNINPAVDRVLGYQWVSGISAYSSIGVNTNVTLPAASDAVWNGNHTYTIGMILDPFSYVAESNENNNSNVGTYRDSTNIFVTAGAADLVGTSFSINSSSVTPGATVNVNSSVANQGGSPASGFYAEIVLSQDGNINPAVDRVLGYQWVSGVSSYSSIGVSTNVTLPSASDSFWTGNHTYTIGMVLDPFGYVAESNKGNNSNVGLYRDSTTMQVSTSSSRDITLSVPFVTQRSQVVGSLNSLCEFASAEMLIEQQFGGKSQADQTTIIKKMALATIGSEIAQPGSNHNNWGAKTYQAQQAVQADQRVIQAGLTTTVANISYDTLKQIVASGRAVSVNVLYGNLDLNLKAGETPVCNSAIGSDKFVGHEIVVIGFSETNHTCRYLDPLDVTKTVKEISIDRFLAATKPRAGGSDVCALYFNA
jgi:hypothetical protein